MWQQKTIEDVLFAFECHMTRKIGQPGKVDGLGKRSFKQGAVAELWRDKTN